MPTLTACEREIRALHEWFVRWYCGDASDFGRVERALAPAFERVTPDGTVQDRAAVIEGIRSNGDAYDTFDIEIHNVERVATAGEHALVRYEEWQTTPDGENGRLSTALFAPAERTDTESRSGDTANPELPAVAWLSLQETWLDPPE
jgi:hypothetical protein